jgi:hypothetical protein
LNETPSACPSCSPARPGLIGELTMVRPLWQLLLEDPAHLSCDECFAVLEYYADVLAASDGAVLSEVLKRLESCPECSLEYRQAIYRLLTKG